MHPAASHTEEDAPFNRWMNYGILSLEFKLDLLLEVLCYILSTFLS